MKDETNLNSSNDTLAVTLLDCLIAWPRGPSGDCLRSSSGNVTAGSVISLVNHRVDLLREIGVMPQDLVLLAGGRGQEFWLDMLALWAVGAVPVPIEPDPNPNRLKIVLDRAKPQWIWGSVEGIHPDRVSALPTPPALKDSNRNYRSRTPFQVMQATDIAIILFTSGTTGEPKGVGLSRAAVIGNALASRAMLKLQSTDVLATAIPYRFVSALSHFLVSILSGATYAGTERSMLPGELIDYLLITDATAYGGSPLQIRWIADWLEVVCKATGIHKGQGLRWIMSSGDYLPEDVGRRIFERLPQCKVFVAYGLTEVAGRICCRELAVANQPDESGDVGYPIAGLDVKVFNDSMVECLPRQLGNVLVRGTYLFDGYIADPLTTAGAFSGEWLKTGDSGFKSLHQSLVLRGRTDEVFKVAGVKFSAHLLAEALRSYGMIADFAILPVVHSTMGMVPYVYLVPIAGILLETAQLMNYLRKSLPTSHLPWRVIAIERIPRTGSGKVDRREMRLIVEK